MQQKSASPVISVRNVVNRFGSQTVHDGVSLDVMPGEVLGIVGGSGSGKSVLLRTMLGLHKPTSGEVLVEGRNICSATDEELLQTKRRYGVTFQ
ncbi:MAG TPA: ATP-binding cassette domain-containing protein, partial [Steroidobacteraceae bacterium]|nr:ATP-binding cassette domain-containing protein [Steroidobacteraceae bacterium]